MLIAALYARKTWAKKTDKQSLAKFERKVLQDLGLKKNQNT
jgi:hypothetical protein